MELFFLDGGRQGKVTDAEVEVVVVEMIVRVVLRVI